MVATFRNLSMELGGLTGHVGDGLLTSGGSVPHGWLNTLDPSAKPFERGAEGGGKERDREAMRFRCEPGLSHINHGQVEH